MPAPFKYLILRLRMPMRPVAIPPTTQIIASLLLACLLLVYGNHVTAQYVHVDLDAVRKELSAAQADSTRARLYGILGWQLRLSDKKEAVRLADEMIRVADPVRDPLRLAEAYRIKGFTDAVNQDLGSAQRMYEKGIGYATKARSHYYLASFYLLTGGMYQDKGDYDKSISWYLRGLKEAEASGDAEMIAFAANNTGEVFSDAGRGVEATLPYFQQALEQVAITHNWQFAGMTWSNLAKGYLAAGRFQRAGDAVHQAVTCLRRSNEEGYVFATVTTDLAEVLTALRRYAEAERYLLKAAHILDSLGLTDNRLIALAALANLYLQNGQLPKARGAADTLLHLSTSYHSPRYMSVAHRILSSVAENSGDLRTALSHFKEYKRWDDSLFNETSEHSIANAEALWKTDQEIKENEQLRQNNLLLQRSKRFAVVALAVLLVAGATLAFAYRALTRKNKELSRRQLVIEQQSAEKDTLLREVNHRVKNNLQIVSGLLNLQAGSVTDEQAKASLLTARERIKVISLIHQNLYSHEQLTQILLRDYINQLLSALRLLYNRNDVTVACHTDPDDMVLGMDIAVPLGLILHEALTNAFKYAFSEQQSGHIRITCIQKDGRCTVEITDNGKGLPTGFDPYRANSLGFRLIRELTRQLRGVSSFTSHNGTIVTISYPSKRGVSEWV